MSRFSLPLRLFGIPIEIHPSFFVIGVLLASNRLQEPVLLVEWLAILTFSILGHELGHALAYRAFGLLPSIELYSFGGLTRGEGRADLSTGQAVLVSFAGPGVGLFLGGLAYALVHFTGYQPPSELAAVALSDFLFINVIWSLVNLLPILPLDGGNISSSLFRRWRGDSGELYAIGVSVVTAVVAAVFSWRQEYSWGALMGGLFAFDNGRRFFGYRRYLAEGPMRERYEAVYTPFQQERWEEAEAAAVAFLADCREEAWRDRAHVVLCFSRLKQKKGEAAWLALREITPERVAVSILEAAESFFFELQQNEAAKKIAELRFHKTRHPIAAYHVACALARLGQPREAIPWLKEAKAAGLEGDSLLQDDPDLESVRQLPEWKSL